MIQGEAQQAARLRAVFFGDSICHGQHVSVERIFVARLAASFNALLAPPVLFENRSINGNTTRQGLERLSYDVTSHRPDLVYVQFGLNDCNVWQTDFGRPRVAPEAYAGNLGEIVSKVRAAGARSVILGTNHPCRLGEEYEARLLVYNDIVREVSRQDGTVLADVRAVSPGFDPCSMLHPDGIHLSEAGHVFYAGFLRQLILGELLALGATVSSSDRAVARR